MNNYNFPHLGLNGSPFNDTRPNFTKNTSETFNASEYEHKETHDLEAYIINLKNLCAKLLLEEAFNVNYYDKMAERLVGIQCIVKRRLMDSKTSSGPRLEELRAIRKRQLENISKDTNDKEENYNPLSKKSRLLGQSSSQLETNGYIRRRVSTLRTSDDSDVTLPPSPKDDEDTSC